MPPNDGRPTTRGGTRLGTSSGRPTTANRPTTGRPTTATARPVTRGTTAGGQRQGAQGEYLDEWDEDDYESEDDGDVFAFVPPDLGPSPATIQINAGTDAYGQPQMPLANPDEAAAAASAAAASSAPAAAGAGEEEETFYFDEATGAVYDSAGRLVEMPAGFDPSTISAPAEAASAVVGDDSVAVGIPEPLPGTDSADTATRSKLEEVRQGIPLPSSGSPSGDRGNNSFDNHPYPDGSRRAAYLNDPRISTDRKSSNASSMLSHDMPVLTHARSVHALPNTMGVLDEVDYLPSSRDGRSSLRHGSRDIGTTAKGAVMLDSRAPVSQPRRTSVADSMGQHGNAQGSVRQRSNRLSAANDQAHTPNSELKFDLDGEYGSDEADKYDRRASSQLGQGEGLAHPVIDGAEVGAMGMRMVELEMEMEEDSPYPEVRASVSNIDDPDMPAVTLRMCVLAFLLNSIAAAANILFSLRVPSPTVTPVIVQLVAYPLGRLLAAILPIRQWHLPKWLGAHAFSLNPGPFNIKEHALISLSANVAIGSAYAFSSVLVLDSPVYYGIPKPPAFGILYMFTSQLIGFGFSGFCVPFLVTPASMIWPQNLVTATVLNTLHAEEDGLDGSMTRFKYFNILAGVACVWYAIVNQVFQVAGVFNWVCWIWPRNHHVNTFFGTASGLGLSVLTFDWNTIQYLSSPLVVPWWAQINIFAAFIGFYLISAPILYYKNVFGFAYLPFNSGASFDRFGSLYDFRGIVQNGSELNTEAYLNYSQLYFSVTLYVLYWTGFAASTSVLVHTALYHGKSLWRGIRQVRVEEDDIHAKFMRRYPTVPAWWYAAILVVTFALSIVVIEVWDTGFPVWALVLALVVAAIYILPAGFIFAMTGTQPSTNLIGELIAGYVMPGKAIPNMLFKVYCVQTLASSLNFVQDLKVGHYMKINPRATFLVQLFATGWTAIVQWAVKQFMFTHVERLCYPGQAQRFECPNTGLFFTSSIVWGVLGPERLFGQGSTYSTLYWGLFAGALAPIPLWFLARRFPHSFVKFISAPIIFNGATGIPPASGVMYTSWFLVGWLFQSVIRKRNFRWWSKYNFVTSAALDFGTVTSYILQFLLITLPSGLVAFMWWGNEMPWRNIDGSNGVYLTAPPNGFVPSPRELGLS